MQCFCLANSLAADAAAPHQWQQHRPERGTPNQQLRRRRSSVVHAGVGIFFTLWSTSSSLAPPQDANRGAQEAVACFHSYAYAAPAGATVAPKASLAAPSRSGRTAMGSGAPGREPDFARSDLQPALLGVVRKRAAAAGPVVGSVVTLPGGEASPGERQAVVEQTASAAPANSMLPETHSAGGGKQMHAQRMDAPAFVQQQAEHGQHATGSKAWECSCEIARRSFPLNYPQRLQGNCLPKGSCVAIACALVAFSIVTVFLLAWLLQWLSAIPSEWILAKRFRRRSLSFFSKKGPTGDPKKDDPFRPPSTAATQGQQQPEHVQQGGGASPDEPLLEEHHTEAVDALQADRGISDRYGNRTTSVPETENGRL